MTYEEALKWTNDSISKGRIQPEQENYSYMYRVQEALEKQIPRKPKFANNIYKQKCYWCPSCSHYFMERYAEDWFNELMLKAMSHTNAYCPNCGATNRLGI